MSVKIQTWFTVQIIVILSSVFILNFKQMRRNILKYKKSIKTETLNSTHFKWRYMHNWTTHIIKWWHIDCCQFSIFFISIFGKSRDNANAAHSILTILIYISCFLNWKFISTIRFEDMEDTKRNMTAQFHCKS